MNRRKDNRENFKAENILIIDSENLPILAQMLASKIFSELRELSEKSSIEKLYTREEAAELLNVSVSTIYKWRKLDRINGITIGRRVYFKHSEIYNLGE